jgi:hypothetical protein
MFLVFSKASPSASAVKVQWGIMYVLCRFRLTCSLAIALYSLQPSKSLKSFSIKQPQSNSLFINLDVDTVVQNIRRDGFCANISLPEQSVTNILESIKDVNCLPDHDGPRNLQTGVSLEASDQFRNKSSRSRYDNAFQGCPTVQSILHDPKLLKIAADYLQITPICMGARLWWSHADAPPYDLKRAGQVFHYDIDDYIGLRFFFYLTDVDRGDGSHVVVRGSHKYKRFSDRIATTRFRTDEDLINFYGSEAIVDLLGPSGFGFAEDPCIFHKGTAPQQTDRLILLIRYSMNDFGNRN